MIKDTTKGEADPRRGRAEEIKPSKGHEDKPSLPNNDEQFIYSLPILVNPILCALPPSRWTREGSLRKVGNTVWLGEDAMEESGMVPGRRWYATVGVYRTGRRVRACVYQLFQFRQGRPWADLRAWATQVGSLEKKGLTPAHA